MSYVPIEKIIEINNQLAQNVNGVKQVAAPDAQEVVQFEKLLQKPATEEISTSSIMEESTYKPETNNAKTLGETVLSGLNSLRAGRDEAYQKVIDITQAGKDTGIDANSMVVLQYEIFAMNTYQDLCSRTADKINQGIQTLFRNQ